MSYQFRNEDIRFDILRQRSLNMRWASMGETDIPLTSADPDFPPAPEILQALHNYIDGGYMPYVPPFGIPGLRESIADFVLQRKGERVCPEWILPLDSAARAMDVVAHAVLQPGEEAIIFDPVDLMFGVSIRRAGGIPVFFSRTKADGHWDLSGLEDLITPQTRMLCLCNPHNPLGVLYSEAELAEILRIANAHNLYIMNDEVWSDIVYSETPFLSLMQFPGELTQKVLTVYGFSKGFSMAGIRGGYLICPEGAMFQKLADAAGVENTVGGVSCMTQVAMMAACNQARQWQDAFVAHLQTCRDYVYARLSAMSGIQAELQEATFVTFFDIRETGLGSEAFVDYMQKDAHVFLIPGNRKWFGPGAEGRVRLCYATSHDILKTALDRMEESLNKLTKGS